MAEPSNTPSGKWRLPEDFFRNPRLSPGGFFGLWLQKGHYEVTQEVAERFGFSSTAVDILRDASQGPDFFEFTRPEAHAQSDAEVAFLLPGPEREERIRQSIEAFHHWIGIQIDRLLRCIAENDLRTALYWLGYLLHGIEDLAAHAGIPNPEHAWLDDRNMSPDVDADSVMLAGHYAMEFMRTLRQALGAEAFDNLRNYVGEGKLSEGEKEKLSGGGWDIAPEAIREYREGGPAYSNLIDAQGSPCPVRWPRERVFVELLESVQVSRVERISSLQVPKKKHLPSVGFQPLGAAGTDSDPAEWTVMVYMAGDDANANGIEYAVLQDLRELKAVGSTDRAHLLVQTDECRQRNSYRYRLRRGTPLAADRLSVYRGDINTGRVGTLVEFVAWCAERFPARRHALILWGHGSGHDDRDIYRLARGTISPRLAAKVAERRLGFFGRTRRAMLERHGPNKGFGFDSTACDFLDNREIKRALSAVTAHGGPVGKPLDLLGFDACLMANIETAYQLRGTAEWMVASEQTEPGDGWPYTEAFRGLVADPCQDGRTLGKQIVRAFGSAYRERQTLSLLEMKALKPLADSLSRLANELAAAEPLLFHKARNRCIDFSPRAGEGYRDLGGFLACIKELTKDSGSAFCAGACACLTAHEKLVQASVGPGTGLSVYLPDRFRPHVANSADALYQLLDFPAACGWSDLLDAMYGHAPLPVPRIEGELDPRYGSLYGMDRHNGMEILQSLGKNARFRHWTDRTRKSVLGGIENETEGLLSTLSTTAMRIFILPGIMGSQLSDRKGQHGLLWIDPIGLACKADFKALAVAPDGMEDMDPSTGIEPVGPVPVVYDRMAVSLMAAFGPCVEYLCYDWRRPISVAARQVANDIRTRMRADGEMPVVLVAHSMGGLVAAKALRYLKEDCPWAHQRISGLAALGTPWQGSYDPVLALKGSSGNVELFARLTRRTPQQVADVVQTFWGLTDMLPAREAVLLDPKLYAPGPLSTSSEAHRQLASPALLDPDPPKNTLAVVCDNRETLSGLVPDGTDFTKEWGPGDGTVPLWSATAGGTLEYVQVNEKHMTLPLNGEAIAAVVDRIAEWTQIRPKTSLTFHPPDGIGGGAPPTREAFMGFLEEMDKRPLPVEALKAMMFLP